jgi:hypothetical protein
VDGRRPRAGAVEAASDRSRRSTQLRVRPPGAVGLLLLALLLCPRPTTAQMVVGRVVDRSSGESLDAVELSLVDSIGRRHGPVLTDASGRFIISLPGNGTYLLHASRLGYDSIAGAKIVVDSSEAVTVEVRMTVQPVELPPLVVVGRAKSLRQRDLHEYFQRIEPFRAAHIGKIYTRKDLEPMDLWSYAEFMRREAPHIVTPGRGCKPLVFWDGSRVEPEDLLPISELEGIEFYRGFGPAQLRFHNPDGCGVVLVWTRPAVALGRHFESGRFAIAVALAAVIAFILGR